MASLEQNITLFSRRIAGLEGELKDSQDDLRARTLSHTALTEECISLRAELSHSSKSREATEKVLQATKQEVVFLERAAALEPGALKKKALSPVAVVTETPLTACT